MIDVYEIEQNRMDILTDISNEKIEPDKEMDDKE